MKNFFVLVFSVLIAAAANAKNYYVAANGNDANNGISSAAPWKTISKLNSSFASIAAGDSILFRRGDTFYGTLIVGKSGTSALPIAIDAYGTGAKPVISGFVTVSPTSWVSIGNGIYQALVSGAKSSLNMVTINNVPKALGRYPNITDANGGYLSYESFSGTTSITDNQMTSATNWVGAELVIRRKLWVLDRCPVTAHSGGTFTFKNTISAVENGTAGFGYFIQNDARTLDQFGEWFLNKSSKYLQVYFGTATPSSYTVKASCLDTLLYIGGKNYINVKNLAFDGANADAVAGLNSTYVRVENCDFTNCGTNALDMQAVSSLTISNCTTNNMLSYGMYIYNSKSNNVTIQNCGIKNTGILPGMGQSGGTSYGGIYAYTASNLLIEYNRVDTTGCIGISFQGSNVTVKNNVVDYFDFIKDDGGGIYSYASGTDTKPGTTFTNRVVTGNIVMNGIGAPYGRNNTTLYASGIYLDGRTMNVNVVNNTVFNNAKNGIHCNNPNNIVIRGNTSYNNLNAMSTMRWANLGVIRDFRVTNNLFYPKTESQRCFYYTNSGLNEPAATTFASNITNLAVMDSNTYSMVNPVGFNFEIYGTSGGALIQQTPYSLEAWQARALHDANGKKAAKLPVKYKIASFVGANKYTNGLFNTAISGLTVYGTGTTGIWDNTGKINGGSLKISFASPVANKYSLLYSTIGAISSAKKYVLRFSTYGTTNNGIVRAYIRKAASPYTALIATQTKSFGIGRKEHEFLFNAPTTDAGGSFVIELEQNSGITYIDNIEFYEVTATMYDVESQTRFEYNATKVAKTVTLDGNYTAPNGIVYSGSLTLQPFTSIVLVKDTGGIVVAPPPATSFKASAIAPVVSCYGGSTTVAVTASGGTAPHTGTGTFAANAGRGSLKLAFPTSTANAYTYLYYTIGAINTSKNYVLRFTTLGTTANGKLKASIRQTVSPYTTIATKQDGTFGTSRKDHEFIFKNPPTQTAAGFQIDIEQASGTTYIDNIAFFECDANGVLLGNNLYADGQIETDISKLFFYSANNNHTATWDNTAKIASTYYYTVKDAANNTAVIPVTISQPASALSVTTTAGIISILGGTTSIVVSASGGTAPYTGVGTFSSILAGTYTYTITDAKGCTTSKTITVLPFVSARPATANAAARPGASNATVLVETGKALELTAYPNPSANEFTLQLVGGTTEKAIISVYSFDGKQVYQAVGNSNAKYNFGSNLMAGVYIVKVVQGNTAQSLKLVKAAR